MKTPILYASFVSLSAALSGFSTANTLRKRESGEFSCYNALNIWDFSALCPNINYPITNDKGLSTMGTLYFALASTTVPDDTIYNAQENIICTVNGPTENITAEISAGVGNDIVGAGVSVTFDLSLPNTSGSKSISIGVCMFTQGTDDDYLNITDPITLKQARDLLYTMLTAPSTDCKTCGRIPVRYPNVTDGTDQGGILKIDRTSSNNCIGKCVGPASFSTASALPSASASSSAGKRVEPCGYEFGLGTFAVLIMAWFLGVAVFGLRVAPSIQA
ncbi:hypothetical protein PMZ80_008888 [Knufia obscura]|uniref:Uncharacterized protein n=1 Tax=Knufia obscura TaxID=1635080 RepID=A0ABR0RDI6_9EURO|nr:hypothetical protein PMZ80_008888 [Knufia obscura]